LVASGYKERGVVGQRDVAGAAIADVDGAKLLRAVGSNWLRNAVAGRPGDRLGDRLLGDVLRTIAHTIDRSLGDEENPGAGLSTWFSRKCCAPEGVEIYVGTAPASPRTLRPLEVLVQPHPPPRLHFSPHTCVPGGGILGKTFQFAGHLKHLRSLRV
jgi:hypothetical protein